jgi:putative FmdB family regulatory protein
MPAYDYLCDACGSRFERRQKMSEAPLESCPQCGGGVQRLIGGGAGAITKGGGQHFGSSAEAPGVLAAGRPARVPTGCSARIRNSFLLLLSLSFTAR